MYSVELCDCGWLSDADDAVAHCVNHSWSVDGQAVLLEFMLLTIMRVELSVSEWWLPSVCYIIQYEWSDVARIIFQVVIFFNSLSPSVFCLSSRINSIDRSINQSIINLFSCRRPRSAATWASQWLAMADCDWGFAVCYTWSMLWRRQHDSSTSPLSMKRATVTCRLPPVQTSSCGGGATGGSHPPHQLSSPTNTSTTSHSCSSSSRIN